QSASLPLAATPTFSPVAGSYTGTQTVTISCSTPASTIYYTTDGSTPTPLSTVYSSPIAVSTSETVKAIATASGYTQSAVGTAVYTINAVQSSGYKFISADGMFVQPDEYMPPYSSGQNQFQAQVQMLAANPVPGPQVLACL